MIYNAQHIPSSILLPEDKKEMAWNDVLDNDKSYCFTAMTMPEYKTLVGMTMGQLRSSRVASVHKMDGKN